MSIYTFLGKVELPATMLSPQILNCGECCLWEVRDIERGRGVALISYRDGGMVTWSWQWSLGHLQWVSSLLTSHSWDVVSNSDRLRYLSFPCSGCKHAPHTTCLCWSKIPGVFVVCLIVIRDFHIPLQTDIAGYVSTKLMKHIFYILVNFIKVGDLHFFLLFFYNFYTPAFMYSLG